MHLPIRDRGQFFYRTLFVFIVKRSRKNLHSLHYNFCRLLSRIDKRTLKLFLTVLQYGAAATKASVRVVVGIHSTLLAVNPESEKKTTLFVKETVIGSSPT